MLRDEVASKSHCPQVCNKMSLGDVAAECEQVRLILQEWVMWDGHFFFVDASKTYGQPSQFYSS